MNKIIIIKSVLRAYLYTSIIYLGIYLVNYLSKEIIPLNESNVGYLIYGVLLWFLLNNTVIKPLLSDIKCKGFFDCYRIVEKKKAGRNLFKLLIQLIFLFLLLVLSFLILETLINGFADMFMYNYIMCLILGILLLFPFNCVIVHEETIYVFMFFNLYFMKVSNFKKNSQKGLFRSKIIIEDSEEIKLPFSYYRLNFSKFTDKLKANSQNK